MIQTIENRRSIRKYQSRSVSKALIEQVLKAGIMAPSSKNRQPWRFTVVSGNSKIKMLAAMEKGLEREKNGKPLLPESQKHLSGAAYTLEIMRQAPVTILVTNPLGLNISQPATAEERIYEICNAQSVGAALENMTLAATELGLGSLWICDIFFAYEELNRWINGQGTLIAAMTLGYQDERPSMRPRKALDEITQWRS